MVHVISDKGARKLNEDSYSVITKNSRKIYIVADGCGGHRAGEVASKLAINCLPELLFKVDLTVDSIKHVLSMCNVRIREEQKHYRGMRTTVAGLISSDGKVWAFNVGDSRLYQIRNGQIVFNTEDHSVPYLLYKAEIISREEINTHEDRNKLLEALGNKEDIKINVYELVVENDDVFVLATDGFWEHFYDKDFEDCNIENAEYWLKHKENFIKQKKDPEQDNYTAIVAGGINE